MDEFDEILGNDKEETKNSNEKKYNIKNNNNKNNNWREKQNKERKEIYEMMNRMTNKVAGSSAKFQEYLDMQSKFYKHSVGNCLAILEQYPQATMIKDESSWKEKEIVVKSSAIPIKILEPCRSNGTTYYNPKRVYDISQTNSTQQEIIPNYDDKKLLQAIFYGCDVPRKAVVTLPNGMSGTEYNKEENVLYVCKGMERDYLFQTLSLEMANIEMKGDEDSNIKNFRSYCISYMFCKRYGIDVSNYEFNDLPDEITTRNEKDIRFELDKIRSNFESINSRVLDFFEQGSKEKNKYVPER